MKMAGTATFERVDDVEVLVRLPVLYRVPGLEIARIYSVQGPCRVIAEKGDSIAYRGAAVNEVSAPDEDWILRIQERVGPLDAFWAAEVVRRTE